MSVHVEEMQSTVEVEAEPGAGGGGAPSPAAAPHAGETEQREAHRKMARDHLRTLAEGYGD